MMAMFISSQRQDYVIPKSLPNQGPTRLLEHSWRTLHIMLDQATQ